MPEVSILRIRSGSSIRAPLYRLSCELAALTGWRRYGLAFLFGVGAAAALPPVDMSPLLLVSFVGLLWLEEGSVRPSASFGLGYAFGFGFFLAGLYWIAIALFVDIATFWWLVPIAAVGLPAAFALYTGMAVLVVHLTTNHLHLPATARIFLFAIAWTAAEWVRGHAFTGLPWNLIGSTWAGGFPGGLAMLQTAAWVGIYGLSFVTVLAASLPALLAAPSQSPVPAGGRRTPAVIAMLLILVPGICGAVRLATSPTADSGIWLRLVQPSIPQTTKWEPRAAEANFQRLLHLSAAPAIHPITAIVWPEAATPFILERDAVHRREIAAIAPEGGYVIVGTLRANASPDPVVRVWNSVEVLNSGADIVAYYDKAHLVPFGEYIPMRDALPFKKITAGSIDLSAGPGPRTIALPGLPAFTTLICYEAIFPGVIVDHTDRPAWMLNLTNDAWYGRSSGPYQHLASARTRSVEEGLPMIRVANNGVSAVIDPVGRVRAKIDLDAVGYADVMLPAPGDRTLYARFGDWALAVILLLGALPVVFRLR